MVPTGRVLIAQFGVASAGGSVEGNRTQDAALCARGLEQRGSRQTSGHFLFRDTDDRGRSTRRRASSVHGFGSPLLRINTGITDTILFDSQSSSAAIMGIMQGKRPSQPQHPDVAGPRRTDVKLGQTVLGSGSLVVTGS